MNNIENIVKEENKLCINRSWINNSINNNVFTVFFSCIYEFYERGRGFFSYPPKFLPSQINFKNYKEALDIMNLKRMLLNSFIVATCTTLGGKIITGTLGAFAFSSFNFKGKNTLFFTLFITLFLPAETVMILPLFMIMSNSGGSIHIGL